MPVRFRMIRLGSARACRGHEPRYNEKISPETRILRGRGRWSDAAGLACTVDSVARADHASSIRQGASISDSARPTSSSIAFRAGPSVVTRRKPAASVDGSISGQPRAAGRIANVEPSFAWIDVDVAMCLPQHIRDGVECVGRRGRVNAVFETHLHGPACDAGSLTRAARSVRGRPRIGRSSQRAPDASITARAASCSTRSSRTVRTARSDAGRRPARGSSAS